MSQTTLSQIILTDAHQDELMRAALAEAKQGMAEGEAPIGCVLATGQGPDLRICRARA